MTDTTSAPNTARTSIRWGLLAAAVVGFAGMAVYLGPSRSDPARLPPELADEPDLYLEQGIITQFRDDGSLHYRLRADQIRRYERLGLSGLEAPVLEFQGPNGTLWRMQSQTGEVRTVAGPANREEEQVELTGGVTVTRDRGGAGVTRIRTESLVIFPERQQARTDQTAMIETDTLSIQAGGFEADLASGKLSFSSSTEAQVNIVAQPDRQTPIRR